VGSSSWPRQDRNLWLYTPQRCLQLHAAEIADVGRAGSGTIDDLLRQMLRVAPSKFATEPLRAVGHLSYPSFQRVLDHAVARGRLTLLVLPSHRVFWIIHISSTCGNRPQRPPPAASLTPPAYPFFIVVGSAMQARIFLESLDRSGKTSQAAGTSGGLKAMADGRGG